jgi:hypothetical protein
VLVLPGPGPAVEEEAEEEEGLEEELFEEEGGGAEAGSMTRSWTMTGGSMGRRSAVCVSRVSHTAVLLLAERRTDPCRQYRTCAPASALGAPSARIVCASQVSTTE